MFERPEPRLIRARTYILLLLAACVFGGAAAEVSNAFDNLPKPTVEVSR